MIVKIKDFYNCIDQLNKLMPEKMSKKWENMLFKYFNTDGETFMIQIDNQYEFFSRPLISFAQVTETQRKNCYEPRSEISRICLILKAIFNCIVSVA